MKKSIFTFIILLQINLVFGQFTDNFSDGNFTANPAWSGDIGNFEVDSLEKLHLNDAIANTSYLSTESKAIINGVWEFEVKMDFAPSSTNYSKVYLVSDKQDLSSSLNGYYVRIGGQSGDIDDISLYTQTGTNSNEIIDGGDSLVANNPNIRVRVTRDAVGNWELFLDTNGVFLTQGTAFDTTIISSDYFGVFCKYTITRSKKFWFDDFNVSGSFLVDTIRPVVITAQINSSASILVTFSEPIDSITTFNETNYVLDNGIGNPINITINNPKTIELFFGNLFVNLTIYQLNITSVQDIAQNSMLPLDTTSSYFLVGENDIIINEIFADPGSSGESIGLPYCEYIELYNNTNIAIDLTNWSIKIGSGTKKIIPSAFINPESFILLVKEDAIDSFPNNISKIGLSSVLIHNEEADIILRDTNGFVINAISYTDKWYNDDDKSEGGWSIERVNPNLYCEGENNWRASIANIGGTPGKENSVFGESVYIDDFRITKAYAIDSNKVKLHFNKSLDSLLLSDSSFFELNGNMAIKSSAVAPFFSAVNLTFNFNFSTQTTYTISADDLIDCSGNLLSNSMIFGIPDSALENDIIINEVLFNPKDDGVDYVEIYNNSNSYFDLSRLRVAKFKYNEFADIIESENQEIITEEPYLFSPKTYLVLTTDSAKVKAQYNTENPYNFIEVASMPPLSNEEGTICIVHKSQNHMIDAFAYHENMHFSLLETEDGVSLERLNPNAETQNSNNWHSAASTVGFGTPTYKNSQELIIQSIGEININPKSFTPNNDGYKDVASINWNFSKNNLMATIKIFDSGGGVVKNILNNEMIGNSGNTTWDGTSEEGLQLNTGMYIVWMEVFSDNGNAERFKEVIVLSR